MDRDYKFIDKIVSKNEKFSGVISIRTDEKTVFEKAYGFADIANERLNNFETRFGIASGAKLFTAIAVCKLIDDGKLKISSLLNEYLVCDKFDADISIGHLLTHTSGLPDYFDEDVMSDFSELWVENPMYMMKEPKDFIPLIINGKMMFKSGEKFHYNNGGFVILAYIVEKVSGMKFADFIQKNILDILEMKNSGYFRMDMLPKNCAYGYEEVSEGVFKTNIYSIPLVGGGDGGIFATVEDIDKLWNGLFKYKLLSKEITDKILTPQIQVNGNCYYGYGVWIVKEEDKIKKWYITGSDPGVTFQSEYYPEENITITILGNKEFNCYEVLKGIIGAI